MLYVFQVDVGTMMTFDMDIVLESVATLKQAISTKYHIDIQKQVLLISGGESLEDDCRVSHYNAAGTDTNPIFLFNKSNIEQQRYYGQMFQQQQQLHDQQLDAQLKKIKQQLTDQSLQPSFEAVVRRTEIAKQLNQWTRELQYNCDCLIRDQHLQYQGWTAVIANLEDITVAFQESAQHLHANFAGFLHKRPDYLRLLQNFDQDLEVLQSIPVHPSLLSPEEHNAGNTDETSSSSTDCSLLDWISQKDSQCSLKQMAEQCNQAVSHLNDQTLANLQEETDQVLKHVQNDDNKKIKKIETRLYELDKLLFSCKKFVQDQELLTAAFIQNQNSAHSLQDPTIFPDLCDSHQTQLQLMLNNYMHMVAIKKKFQAAKLELVNNLHSRLRLIMSCETDLSEIRWKIFMYSENLRKLKRNLEVLEQVNLAPDVYRKSIGEIVRRRHFSSQFRRWSNAVAEYGERLYKEETEKRHSFKQMLNNHFLKAVFTGLEDDLPEFATRKPAEFDLHLPCIETNLKDSDVPKTELFLPPPLGCFFCDHQSVANVLETTLSTANHDDKSQNGQKDKDCTDSICAVSIVMQSESVKPVEVDVVTVEEDVNDDSVVVNTNKMDKSALLRSDLKMDLDQMNASTMKLMDAVNVKSQTAQTTRSVTESTLSSSNDVDTVVDHQRLESRLREEYERKMFNMKVELEAKLEAEKSKLEIELIRKHQQELDSLKSHLHHQSCKSSGESDTGESSSIVGQTTIVMTGNSRASKRANKKAMVNESLKRANREKDQIIEQLRSSQETLSVMLNKIKGQVDALDRNCSNDEKIQTICQELRHEIACFPNHENF